MLKGITRSLVALQPCISRLVDVLQLTKHQAHWKEWVAWNTNGENAGEADLPWPQLRSQNCKLALDTWANKCSVPKYSHGLLCEQLRCDFCYLRSENPNGVSTAAMGVWVSHPTSAPKIYSGMDVKLLASTALCLVGSSHAMAQVLKDPGSKITTWEPTSK